MERNEQVRKPVTTHIFLFVLSVLLIVIPLVSVLSHSTVMRLQADHDNLLSKYNGLNSTVTSQDKAWLGTFAFYYPWYGTPNVSGYWNHWNSPKYNPDNFTDGRRDIPSADYPLLDVYDSNNESVV